ncbi:MAG: hypothetical protein WKG07_27865 [Hymenobacter sp.]
MYETGESLRIDDAGVEVAGRRPARAAPPAWAPPPPPARAGGAPPPHLRAPGPVALVGAKRRLRAKRPGVRLRGRPLRRAHRALESPVNGYVVGLNYMPVVNQGDALLHIGLPREGPGRTLRASFHFLFQ